MHSVSLVEKKLLLEELQISASTIVSVISVDKLSRLPTPTSTCSEKLRFGGLLEKFFLDWVKASICQFGGDPDKITV